MLLLNFMPTETYHEITKGVYRSWYAHREKLPKKQEIRIRQNLFDRIKETIKRNGLKLDSKKFISERSNLYDTQVYVVYGAKVLINHMILGHLECECILHIQPKDYLTISAKNEESLEAIAEKLGLPLETQVE